MNSAIVKIHEFSTGIQAERTSDGWVSRGFTGEYMNKTLDPIPVAIQSAIANREFAVAEGASSNEPAIIGREVRGGGEVWSAIAVVTRGRDDRGRSASMYRYFFCEGEGNLWKILAWIESLRQAGRMPIFNPFETKIVGQPNEYPVNNRPEIPIKKELQYLLINNEAPIIIPSGQPCMASILNEMAAEKARANGQPVAWAYKAEALEQPRSFQVIQPASEKAEQLLQRAIASTPQYTAPIAGEYELKSAIKGLISRDKVKLDQVQAIETAINKIQNSDWEVIFNGQGVPQALKQGIYSPQMVRLLTLRAMVIPQTLPDFVDWMQKRGKQEDHYQISDIFQSEIHNSLSVIPGKAPNFTLKVSQGVKLIIPRLVDQPELLEGVVWLLSSREGFWQQVYSQQVVVDIDHYLNWKGKQQPNSKSQLIDEEQWRALSSELQGYWQQQSYPPDERYQAIADLFGQLPNSFCQPEFSRIAAFFYHVGYGEVPKNIFRKISNNRGGLHSKVYGVTIKRKVPLTEVLGVWIQEFFAATIPIGEIDMPLWFALFILLIFTSSGFGVGLIVGSRSGNQQTTPGDSSANNPTGNNTGSSPSSVNSSPASNNPSSSTSDVGSIIPTGKLESGKQKFNGTKTVIQTIIKQIQTRYQERKTETEIIRALKSTLALSSSRDIDLPYSGVIVINDKPLSQIELKKAQENWVSAIYDYQKNNGLNNGNPEGFISENGLVKDRLKEDIIKTLENNPPGG